MSKRGNVVMVALLGASLSWVACKKTVEGENKAWERNVARVGELSALYPGFATALKEQHKKAEDAMTAAKAVSNSEESAKKMSEANGILEGFVSTLGGLDAKQKALRQKLISASTDAQHASDQAGARAAVEDAQRILRNVDDALKTGAPNADAAVVVARKLDGDLTSATSNVDKVIASAKARKAEEAKAKGGDAKAGDAKAGTPPAGVTPTTAIPQWQCKFCKHMNDGARTTCTECGGAKPAPGAVKGPAPAPGKPAAPPPKKK